MCGGSFRIHRHDRAPAHACDGYRGHPCDKVIIFVARMTTVAITGDAARSPRATPPIRPGEGGGAAHTAALMSLCRYRRADRTFLTWLLCRATVGRAALTRREGRTVDRGGAAERHNAARAAPSLCQGQRARDASVGAGGAAPLRLSQPWAPSDARR